MTSDNFNTAANNLSRRQFLVGSTALAVAGMMPLPAVFAEDKSNLNKGWKISAFIKHIQELKYAEMASFISECGYDGVEATVRAKGYILPEAVEDELPKFVEELSKHNLKLDMITSDITSVDTPHAEKLIKTAVKLGITRYRMGYYHYNLKEPIAPQMAALRPILKDLGAMNASLGMTGMSQNHAGVNYVGAGIWDMYDLVKDIPKEQISLIYDIRHATVEGGTSWPTTWNLVQPQLGFVYIKDFKWNGRSAENVPLGEGMVNPKFFDLLQASTYRGPIALHVEYLDKSGLKENCEAIAGEIKRLRSFLKS
jgi:sugar phosphate isomerase/epimerase